MDQPFNLIEFVQMLPTSLLYTKPFPLNQHHFPTILLLHVQDFLGEKLCFIHLLFNKTSLFIIAAFANNVLINIKVRKSYIPIDKERIM